jgi:hypothetical protein
LWFARGQKMAINALAMFKMGVLDFVEARWVAF